jgi:hypothetical protein
MSQHFFIFAFEYDGVFSPEILPDIRESDLIIDIDEYRERLIRDWGRVRFEPLAVLEWVFETESLKMFRGPYEIHSDYSTLSMDRPDGEFALWHRSVIPERYRLFITGENTGKAIELTMQTSLEDLRQVFS